MSRKVQARSKFLLTPTEARALKLYRSGLTVKEVCKEMGWKYMTASHVLYAAIDKERVQAQDDRDKGSGSSLNKARGRIRMEGTK